MSLISRERALTISMMIGAAAAILLGSFAAFAEECEELPDKLFRLHIVANSDSEEDQELKYALRDRIMSDMEDIFADCSSAAEARDAARENLPLIAAKAKEFLEQSGSDYSVTVSVENMFFTTRRYGGLTVPAGYYDALRIVIGEGEGHNWWCVMFPPLCLGAAEDFVMEREEIFMCRSGINSRLKSGVRASEIIESGEQKTEFRFWIFEKLFR